MFIRVMCIGDVVAHCKVVNTIGICSLYGFIPITVYFMIYLYIIIIDWLSLVNTN